MADFTRNLSPGTKWYGVVRMKGLTAKRPKDPPIVWTLTGTDVFFTTQATVAAIIADGITEEVAIISFTPAGNS